MKLCGLTDKKEARKQVNAALEVLFDVSISYDDSKNKNKSRNYRDMRLVDDKGISHVLSICICPALLAPDSEYFTAKNSYLNQ